MKRYYVKETRTHVFDKHIHAQKEFIAAGQRIDDITGEHRAENYARVMYDISESDIYSFDAQHGNIKLRIEIICEEIPEGQ